MRMSAAFQPGDPVRQHGASEEMIVEGYDDDGRVICSYWQGITRAKAAFLETDLEPIPPPKPLFK
jgi:uncharacterized protein YodC (DUF2158 family)